MSSSACDTRFLASTERLIPLALVAGDLGSSQGLLADWAPPQGHASFSWRASKRRRPSSHSSFSWPLSTLSCCSAFSVRQPDAGLLLRIVAHVRSVEETTSFRRSLLEGQRGMASQLGVDRETFTYGSTPFASWHGQTRPVVALALVAAPGLIRTKEVTAAEATGA